MHFIHFFNILSIISVSALAAPAPDDVILHSDHVESLEARTFGHLGHKKSYRQSCQANYEGGYWTAPVEIGGKTKQCKVSTGAADLLIIDDSFSSSVRSQAGLGGFIGGFLGKLTGKLSHVGGASWGYKFGAGIDLKGSIYNSIVSCGGLAVKSMQFGCLDKKASLSAGVDFEGVLGLGFKGASAIKPYAQASFFQQVSANTVGLVFKKNNPYLEFGAGVDASVYAGSLVSFAIDASAGLWAAGGLSFTAGGKKCGKGKYTASFDTSAATCSFSADVAAAYWAQVKGAIDLSVKKDGSKWCYPCALKSLPAFDVSTGASGSFSIPGAYLASGVEVGGSVGKGMCLGGIQGGVSANAGVFGFPFFASNYAHFDLSGPKLSCAPYKGQDSPSTGAGYGFGKGIGAGISAEAAVGVSVGAGAAVGAGASGYGGSGYGAGRGGLSVGGGFFIGGSFRQNTTNSTTTSPTGTGVATLPSASSTSGSPPSSETSPIADSSAGVGAAIPAFVTVIMAALLAIGLVL